MFIFSPAEGSAALVDNELTAVSAARRPRGIGGGEKGGDVFWDISAVCACVVFLRVAFLGLMSFVCGFFEGSNFSQLPSGLLPFFLCLGRVPIPLNSTNQGCIFSHGHRASALLGLV